MNLYSDHQSLSRSELIELGLPIVNRIAHYLHGRVPDHVGLEDMIQIGTIGLMRLRPHLTKCGSKIRRFRETKDTGSDIRRSKKAK